MLFAASLTAETRTWNGSSSALWYDEANWDALPSAGDDLVFPAGAVRTATVNDYADGTPFRSIEIQGSGYSIGGSTIGIGEGGITSSASATISASLQLAADSTWSSVGGTLTISGEVDTSGFTLALHAGGGDGLVSGILSGAATGIVKNGPGDWTLSGDNTFSGPIVVDDGRLRMAHSRALGVGDDTPANGTTVNDGASLVLPPGVSIKDEHLTIYGAGHGGNGVLQVEPAPAAPTETWYEATVVLGDGNVAMNLPRNAILSFLGRVTGSGRFGMGGAGGYSLNNSDNDFTGPVIWRAIGTETSWLYVTAGAIPSTVSLYDPQLRLRALPPLSYPSLPPGPEPQSLVSISGGGRTELVEQWDWRGRFRPVLVLTNPTGSYTGGFHGAGTVIVSGGDWTLGGSMEWTYGTLSHTGGTLMFSGTISGRQLDEGHGTIAPAEIEQSGGDLIVNGGLIDDKMTNVPLGHVNITGGTITPVTGQTTNFTLGAGATYKQHIGTVRAYAHQPLVAQDGFGRLRVRGKITLAGTLELTVSGAPYPAGMSFIIIENMPWDGSLRRETVSGTFAGLPEGATITSGGQSFTISYGWHVSLTATTFVAPTATTLSTAPNPSTSGQNVTLTATVTSAHGTPQGTVEFFDGGVPLGSSTLSAGTATLTTATLAAGSHHLTAQYVGSPSFSTSTSARIVHVVNAPASTTTSLATRPNPSRAGEDVTLTATVTSRSGTPTGTVSFFDGPSLLGVSALSGNTATFNTATLAVGSHDVTAQYSGDERFAPSTSAPVVHVVALPPGNTTTSLATAPSPSVVGQDVTLTATVSSGSGTPTGSVSFFDRATLLGVSALSGNTARIVVSALPAGSYELTAQYTGDSAFAGSTSNVVVHVVQPPTATMVTLAAAPNPSVVGQTVVLTATLPNAGATGTVIFYDGATVIGVSTVFADTATLAINTLAAGSHTLTAAYTGNASLSPGTSAPVVQVVHRGRRRRAARS